MGYLPCGVYHQNYRQDHAWWQTRFVWGKMVLLFLILFILIPQFTSLYLISVANVIGYTILSAMGVQLLIGFCGQVTLGHSAFLAVGAYTSTLLCSSSTSPTLSPSSWEGSSVGCGASCSVCPRPASRGSI